MSFQASGFEGKNVVVTAGVRSPFAKAGTALAGLSAVDLGVFTLKEAIAQSTCAPEDLDHVIMGNIGQPADSANIARVISLFAGVPKKVPAFSVQRNCASALEAISQGALEIATGQASVVAVGGTESMSQIPLLFSDELKSVFMDFAFSKKFSQKLKAFSRFRLRYLKPQIALEMGLRDPVSGFNMGETAERLARDFQISRQEQDEFALRSHQKAVAGRERLAEELTPAYIPPRYKEVVEHDIGPREGQSIEALAKLKPYFDRRHGTVTVGNSCPITDGAAVLILMEEEKAKAEGRPILGRIRSVVFSGCEPKRMGLGPVYAAPKALKAAGYQMQDMELVEINEAFAAQVLTCLKAFASKKWCEEELGIHDRLEISEEKLNVNGGAVALGHPVGTSGARLVLTLLKELKRRNQQRGLASLCIGGGQGGACVVEQIAS